MMEDDHGCRCRRGGGMGTFDWPRVSWLSWWFGDEKKSSWRLLVVVVVVIVGCDEKNEYDDDRVW
jgi:hypothetical protein